MGICDLLGFIFVSYCARQRNIEKKPYEKFDIDFQWSFVNFTWPSPMDYHYAVTNSKYIPENNAMSGIKYYNNRMYVALPRLRPGTPVTLAFIPLNSKTKTNPLLRPFPSWDMNVQKNCSTLQNVHSMEIDRYGVMWVIDGVRTNGFTKCPPKIVLLDLKNAGKVLHTYVVPNDVTLHQGGLLNDIVIDESDGGFAYITDNSMQDPGLVVYSRSYNKSWKFRDSSMYPEVEAADFTVDGVVSETMTPISGIAMGPIPMRRKDNRMVYYSALTSYSLYSLGTHVLKDKELCRSGEWRREVEYVGQKRSQSNGLVTDSKGNLYYGLLSRYGVGRWNVKKPFETARNVDINKRTIIWPDSFAFDNAGHLYLLANGMNKYLSRNYQLKLSTDIKFRILKMFTGTNSYLYMIDKYIMNSCLGGCFAIKNQKSSLLVRGQSYLPCQSSSCTLCRNRVVVYEAWTDPDLSKRSKHSSNSSNYSCYTNCGSNRLDDFEDYGNYWIDDDCESSIGQCSEMVSDGYQIDAENY
ncbi:hypothetical protein FQR65_LT10659 [Abscondita terminalis]|nr:hypothetical protein FQR65_LT10659 [Abscondita terminalis]